MSQDKAIDWELGTKLAGGKEELARQMIELLAQELPETRIELSQLFQQRDFDNLQKAVHKLHGGTCYCGVPFLKKAAKTFEDSLRAEEQEKFPTQFQHLLDEIDRVMGEFAQLTH